MVSDEGLLDQQVTKHFKTARKKTNKKLFHTIQIVFIHVLATCLSFSLNISTDGLRQNTLHLRYSIVTVLYDTLQRL